MAIVWLTTPVEALWPEADKGKVTGLIERAESIIRTRIPSVTSRVATGELELLVVTGVVHDMVDRVVQKQARGGLDKLSYPEVSMEWDDGGGLGQGSTLFLTTDEFAMLAPSASANAFTIGHTPRPVMPW